MPPIYLNQTNKEKSATLFVLAEVFEHFDRQPERAKELFSSSGWKWLKTSKSFLMKAMGSFASTIGEQEWSKVEKLAKNSDFVVISKGLKAGVAEVVVKEDHLFDMANLAMGKSCSGCMKSHWKRCELFKTLQGCDIPVVQETRNDCPYRQ
jgi:hypothetical protein